MSEVISNLVLPNENLQTGAECQSPKDDVVKQKSSRASGKHERLTKTAEDVPHKRRKTRRGKSKRKQLAFKKRNVLRTSKAVAPYNSNQFLLDDHESLELLDKQLKCPQLDYAQDATRTRESSFSMESEADFYSSPDDEEQFIRKEFDTQYEALHDERLNNMPKNELIKECINLEQKLEILTAILHKKGEYTEDTLSLQLEIERLRTENTNLKEQNVSLQCKLTESSYSSSDSESDSSSSSGSDSSASGRTESPDSACFVVNVQ